ncbi:major prion protein-like [Eleutherodactylus coqui]|uniref:major prion protein-like n=1 Tax=Eleutherodactylus coqui TaxID=57060 RepID=UPI003461D86C
MTKAFWIHVALIFFLILMAVTKTEGGGRSKRSGSKSEGTQSPNPEGSSYKFTKSETIWKDVPEVVEFMIGKSNSNTKYLFGNDMDSRYYNSYQNQMPSRVYIPIYLEDTCVTKDRFVTDCYNMSMTQYMIKPNARKNDSEIDQTEVRVKSAVIRQLCVSEYKREPVRYMSSGIGLFSPSLIIFITLFVYFVVE